LNRRREKKALNKHLSALADKPHTRITPGEARWIVTGPLARHGGRSGPMARRDDGILQRGKTWSTAPNASDDEERGMTYYVTMLLEIPDDKIPDEEDDAGTAVEGCLREAVHALRKGPIPLERRAQPS
jgi:hypothetical protein